MMLVVQSVHHHNNFSSALCFDKSLFFVALSRLYSLSMLAAIADSGGQITAMDALNSNCYSFPNFLILCRRAVTLLLVILRLSPELPNNTPSLTHCLVFL